MSWAYERYNLLDWCEISDVIGKTFGRIDISHDQDEILFQGINGDIYLMYHSQDCCESVTIEEIIGDMEDLIDSPILKAEKVTNRDMPAKKDEYGYSEDSWTWTFYHIATIKGTVTLRWYGESNGYYSEEVDIDKVTPKRGDEF